MKWKIEYDNDTGARDDYFSQWWNVTDDEMRFTCDSEEEAKWLCDKLNSGEQQPVTGERIEVEFQFMFRYGEHKGGGAYNLSSPIIIPNEKLPLIKQAIEQVLNHQPPTPEPAGELYRWVKASERLPKGGERLFLRLYGKELTVGYWKKDQFQESVDGGFYQPQFVEWLEKVEPQQNQDE